MSYRITKVLALGLLAGLVVTQRATAQEPPTTLPVYSVAKTGATVSQAEALASRLGISSKDILTPGGAINFVDPSRYLSIPTESVTNSKLLEEAIAATRNKDSALKITPTILNAAAVGQLEIVPPQTALSKTVSALDAADLTPQFGEASVGHHELSLYSKNGEEKLIRQGSPIDTEVTYKFTTPNGYPIFGPGAEVQVAFDATGHVSRVLYAARVLRILGTVTVISQAEANERIIRLFGPNSIITSRLVYFAPPLSSSTETPPVATLIPWYAYYARTFVIDSKTGATAEVRSKIGFIPATDDSRFVPVVSLSAEGGSQVHASVAVKGGREPYQYFWGGSNSGVSRTSEPSIAYTPQVRATEALLRNPLFDLHRNETLSVTVVDANGISVDGSVTVPVEATPLLPEGRGISFPTYGSENPGDPLHWKPARVAWNTEMSTSGAGANLSFDWLGSNAWPGDFIRPTPAGTLVPTPWVYGDADYANWGVDTADIVLDNADGWSDGTVLMQPGAPATDYSTSSISTPVSSATVSINGHGFGVPASYAVNYDGSWGPVGPNDTLEWLLLDDCDMLNLLDGSNLNVAQRWGPAFGGLHVLTGFASLGYGDGPFEGGVADNVLGIHGPAQTIVQSWFNSATATGAGTAAAMGPALEILPGIFICDYNDHFWNKGFVGPTLVPSGYPAADFAYWYLTDTSSIQYLF